MNLIIGTENYVLVVHIPSRYFYC